MSLSYEYEDSDSELYKTNLYSGGDADIAGTEVFTSDIDLTTYMGATVDFQFDASGNTDDLILKLYRRRDSSWDDDEIAQHQVTVSSDGSEDIYTYTIDQGAGHFRFGMVRSGSTDTFDIDVEMRRWRVTT